MAEIRLLPDRIDPVPFGLNHNGWYAVALVGGDAVADVAAPTVELALASLAQKLVDQMEEKLNRGYT